MSKSNPVATFQGVDIYLTEDNKFRASMTPEQAGNRNGRVIVRASLSAVQTEIKKLLFREVAFPQTVHLMGFSWYSIDTGVADFSVQGYDALNERMILAEDKSKRTHYSVRPDAVLPYYDEEIVQEIKAQLERVEAFKAEENKKRKELWDRARANSITMAELAARYKKSE